MLRSSSILLPALLLAGCVSIGADPARLEKAETSGICHVHHVRMTKERVAIVYGLVAAPMGAAYEAQVASFPFAHRQVLGGCVIMDVVDQPEQSSPRFADILICDDCDAAKARWIFLHPWDPWARTWKQQRAYQSTEPTLQR